MKRRSATIPAPKCIDCGTVFPPSNRGKKYCSETCKSRHNVQKLINQIKRTTFTIAEAAGYYGCSLSTIRSRVKRNGIETFKVDGRVRLRQSDIVRLFENA